MKALKIVLKVVGVLVALLVVALLALPLWFGPVAKGVANMVVPGVVKTDFHLGHLHLNPYTARFELGEMQLSNPSGYSEKYAATLGSLVFDAETLSLMTDVIHIEEITVKDVFVSVVDGGENKVGNFKQIQYNLAGGKEKYEAAEAEKLRLAEIEAAKPQEETQEEPSDEKSEKRVIIDKLHISGLKIQYGVIPISIPVTIELTDIGRKSGGATLEEAWQQIWESILKSAGFVGDQLKQLGNLTGDAAKQVTAAAAKATEDVSKAATKATDAVGNAANKTTELVGKGIGLGTDGLQKGTELLGDGVKSVGGSVEKIGDGAGKAIKAIGDIFKK